MSVIQRFSDNKHGAIVITGNTLGLSRQRFTQNPGTDNAINQFITTNNTLPVPPAWSGIANPAQNENITFSWQQNSSSATLNMPSNSTVLYAELIWGGMSVSLSTDSNPPIDVTADIDNPITFTTPTGSTQIFPDPATSQIEVFPSSGTFYVRTQNVTSLIASSGIGEYTVGGVPSAINLNEINTLNNAGWTLIVAYQNTSLPPRNLNIYVCEELIATSQFTDVEVTGFLTPPSGIISSRILVGAQEGDANLTGDQLLFGPDVTTLLPLSGPNNPSNNFFCSQINIGDPNNNNVGQIDTSGSFGGRNANAIIGTMVTAGRQGWDITNVDGSSNLVNSQNQALIRITTSGDVYVLNTIGIQIDTILVTGTKSVDKTFANLGDVLTYTVNLTNEGGIPQSFTFFDSIPTGTTYVTDSLIVSTSYTGNLEEGIQLTNIPSGQTVQVTWQVEIGASIPTTNPIQNTGKIAILGLPDSETNTVNTRVLNADLSIQKSVFPDPLIGGQLVTYTIFVENLGPDSAQNVYIHDTIPSEIINPEFSSDNGVTWNPWISVLNLGTLGAGLSKTIMIRGMFLEDIHFDIENTASVSSTTADPNPLNNSVTIITPVVESADIWVVKTNSISPVIAGNFAFYSLFIKNDGPSISHDVVLTDTIPSSISSAEYSINNGETWNPFSSPLAIGDLNISESRTILIRGKTLSSTISDFENTAIVSSDTHDPNLSNNTSTVNTPIATQADISVIKSVNDNTPSIGDTLIYTLILNNIGPSDAQMLTLSDVMPSILINQEYSLDQINWLPWTGTYDFGTFIYNRQETFYLRGVVNAPGIIENTATVSATTFDPNLSNNTSTIQTQQQPAILSISKSADTAEIIAGNVLTYTIRIENLSSEDARNVSIEDILPSFITSPEYSLNSGIDWIVWNNTLNVGTIPANSNTFVLLLRGRVSPSATGAIENTVTATSTNAPPTSDTETTDIDSSADIYIQKTGQPEPITAGQQVFYTMQIGNNGPSDSVSVIFHDMLPLGITNAMISYNFQPYIPWEAPYTLNIGVLPANVPEITIRIMGTVLSSVIEDIINTAQITSDTYDPDPSNNTSEYRSTIVTSADLGIVKSDIPNPVTAGEEITYELTITNDGISDAQQVLVTDVVSDKIMDPQYSLTGTAPWTDWIENIAFDSIATSQTVKIYIRGTVSPDASGEIINQASVSSETYDPNPLDNEFELITSIVESADVSIEKRCLTKNAVAGLPILYQIIIKNNGPSTARNVEVLDLVVSNVCNTVYSIDNGITWNELINPLQIGDLQVNQNVQILINGTICPASIDNLVNSTIVRSSTPDSNPNNNRATIHVPIQTVADLAVQKLESSNNVSIGEYLTYSIAAVNLGPSNAVQAQLVDALPSYLDSPEFSLNNGVTWNPWVGSVIIPIAVVGTLYTALIRGIVNESAIGNTITNQVVVSSQTQDPRPENNTSTITSTLRNIVDLTITKTANNSFVSIGDMIIYTIDITNLGPDIAEDVLLKDLIPSNIETIEYALNDSDNWQPFTGELSLGTLNATASITLKLRGRISTFNNYILNTATVTTSSQDINLDNNFSTIVTLMNQQADINISQKICSCRIGNCYQISAWIFLENKGPSLAENVILIDYLPYEMKKATISINYETQLYPFTGCVYIGSLLPHEKVCVLIEGSIPKRYNHNLYNTVEIYSSTHLIGDSFFTIDIPEC